MSSKYGVLYIGVTNDLARRISEHKLGIFAGFSKKYNCHNLVYYENYQDIQQAITREKQLKGWIRKKKENLIKTINPKWKDLSEEWV
jgi:putative endonuclease